MIDLVMRTVYKLKPAGSAIILEFLENSGEKASFLKNHKFFHRKIDSGILFILKNQIHAGRVIEYCRPCQAAILYRKHFYYKKNKQRKQGEEKNLLNARISFNESLHFVFTWGEYVKLGNQSKEKKYPSPKKKMEL